MFVHLPEDKITSGAGYLLLCYILEDLFTFVAVSGGGY